MRRSIILILFVVLCSQAMGQAVDDAAPAAPGGPVPTAAQPKDMTSLEVVERVERFFDRSWGRLLVTLAIAAVVLSVCAVGVPWYLDCLRKKDLKLKEKEILDRISDAMKAVEDARKHSKEMVAKATERFNTELRSVLDRIENAEKEASERIAGITAEFEKKLTEHVAPAIGLLWHEFGHRSLEDWKRSKDRMHLGTAIASYVFALRYISARSGAFAQTGTWTSLIKICREWRREAKAVFVDMPFLLKSLRDPVKALEQKPGADKYAEDFATLKNFLDESEEAAKKPGDSEPSGGSESKSG